MSCGITVFLTRETVLVDASIAWTVIVLAGLLLQLFGA
jgi:hypothetical protein